MDDVLFPLLLLEPLLDLGSRLIALADGQPVPAGAFGGFGGQHLHNIAVFQGGVDVGDAVIHLRADHGISHAGMDGIGKIDGRGAGGQGNDPSLGGVDEHLVVEHVNLHGLDELFCVGILLAFQQTAHPLEILLGTRAGALLVLPVGGDAVFGGLVHLPCADLHLEGDALRADDGGVQGLVHVGLGRGDIVLEPSRHQTEQVVDVSQHVIAVGDGVHNDPESVNVVQLVNGLALGEHFPVDGIDVLDPPVGGVVDTHGGQALGDLVLDGAHKGLVLLLVGLKVGHDLVILHGGEVPQSGILQLPLDLLHTKAVGKGRVNVHCLPALLNLLFRRLVLHGAHVVEPVGNFDQHHPDVLAHGHEHLAQILHLRLLGGGEIRPGQLCDALHQLRHGGAEDFFNVLMGGVGVLDAVVEQGAQNGVAVQPHLRHDLGDRQGVDDVGRTVLPLLHLVLLVGVIHGTVDERHVRARQVLFDCVAHRRVMFFKGFHFKFSSLSRAAAAAWSGFGSGRPFLLRGSAGWKHIYAAAGR